MLIVAPIKKLYHTKGGSMNEKKKFVGMYLEPSLVEYIDKNAKRLGLSRTAYVQMTLKLKKEEEEKTA